MSFNDDLLAMVRVSLGLIGDETVSDDELLMRVYTAAQFVAFDLHLGYTVDVVGQTITPDPTGDITFAVMTTLKASEFYCLGLLRNDTLTSGVKVRLGPSSIEKMDSHSTADLVAQFADDYKQHKIEYLTAIAGDAICGPATLPGVNLP